MSKVVGPPIEDLLLLDEKTNYESKKESLLDEKQAIEMPLTKEYPPKEGEFALHTHPADLKDLETGGQPEMRRAVLDRMVLVVFLAQAFAFFALSVHAVSFWSTGRWYRTINTFIIPINSDSRSLTLIFASFAVLFSGIALSLPRKHAVKMMKTTSALIIISQLAWIGYDFSRGKAMLPILNIIALFALALPFLLRVRLIAMACLLQIATAFLSANKLDYLVTLGALALKICMTCILFVASSATFDRWAPMTSACTSTCSWPIAISLLCFETFSFMWICQVIDNLAIYTVSGVFASYYLSGKEPFLAASWDVLGLGLKQSLGSIALGSVFVPIFKMILTASLYAYVPQMKKLDPIQVYVTLYGSMSITAAVLRTRNTGYGFQRHAYVKLVLGEPSYSEARKLRKLPLSSKTPFKDHFVGTTMATLAIIVGLLTAAGVSMCIWVFYPAINLAEFTNLRYPLLAFWFGLELASALLLTREIGVLAMIVCLYEHPDLLAKTSPKLLQIFAKVYPEAIVAPQATVDAGTVKDVVQTTSENTSEEHEVVIESEVEAVPKADSDGV